MRLVFLLMLSLAVANGTYLITYPIQWSSGDFTMTISLLSINGSHSQADVTLQVQPNGIRKELSGLRVGSVRQVTFNENELLAQGARNFQMSVTGKVGGRPFFSTTVNGAKVPPPVTIFIQLERFIYTSSEEVRFNVFGVSQNLLPFPGPFQISVWNPNKVLMQSWSDVRAENGVISLHFPLSVQAEVGIWNITVQNVRFQSNAEFKVVNYVRATDAVIMEFPDYFLDDGSGLSGTITAWSRGQLVRGLATVILRAAFHRTTFEMTVPISGPTNVNISQANILTLFPLHFPMERLNTFLNISVVVNDQTGSSMYNTTSIRVMNSRVVISNVKNTQFKSGLNFHYDIMVSHFDGEPLTAQERGTKLAITVAQDTSGGISEGCWLPSGSPTIVENKWNLTIPSSGIVSFQVPTFNTTRMLVVEARYKKVVFCTTIWLDGNTLDNDGLQITTNQSVATVGNAITFHVESVNPIAEVLYQVVAKGQVVESGTATTPWLSLMPSRAWGPVAHVIAYVGTSTESIIHDMVSLPLQGYINKVDVTWQKATAMSEELVNLLVEVSDPESFVGVTASPTEGAVSVDVEHMVLKALEPDVPDWIFVKFEAAGLAFKTDGMFSHRWESLRQLQNNARMQVVAWPSSSESWFWQTRVLGSNRWTRFTDTTPKTTRMWQGYALSMSNTSGLGLGQTITPLKVFSPLHVSMNVPRAATLGEEFIIEVTVTNQQEEDDAEVVVTLLENDANFTVLFSAVGTVTNQRGLTVPAGAARTAMFAVSLLVMGEISFTVVVSHGNVNYTATVYTIVKFIGFPQIYSQSILFDHSPTNFTFNFTFPANYVNGSGSAVIYIYGNLMGPSLCGLEDLLHMPYGCGEQTMIFLAPGIYIRIYLEITLQITPSITITSQTYMTSGYQRELNYMRTDGSFSAFGNSDAVGSTWLTAFVLRSLLQAQRYISVDQQVISKARNFLLSALKPTGEFVEHGYVIHKGLQGGSAGPLSLTAYTLLAFLEDPMASQAMVASAVTFLEANIDDGGPAASLPLAIIAYALTLANSSKAAAALVLLDSRATAQGDLKFWEDTASGQLQNSWQPTAVTIEATAYALLTYLHQGKMTEGLPIMKWLSQQRNHLGGYSSTQDTVVALQALSEYSALSLGLTSGSVTVSAAGLAVPRTITLSGVNITERHVVQIPTRPNIIVNLFLQGSAFIIAQLNVFYNTRNVAMRRSVRSASAAGPDYKLTVQLNDNLANGSVGEQLLLTACTSWMGDDESGMALMDVNLLSGFVAAKDHIQVDENLKLVEETPGKLHLYFVNLTDSLTCVNISQYRTAFVSNAMNGAVTVSDYYEPRRRVQQEYSSVQLSKLTTCSLCGPDCTRCRSNVKGGAVATSLPPTLLAVALLAALGQALRAL